ncbi:sugar ABC transporter substrate-binding protein [Homoserinibacter sp. YIM 151385]|uniref:sugar ABC transporter substrate-binding protein n=1 Tax=Homoserinibacter sp. YIM 151385 TaxID=2985506 RepID=UPI0022F00A96|nr:sugar ABC transporter substrate-binding protein [Homoserinibacter sp. YIM 151385]WBU37470.1 sugar ABC transporter substrate-binding protein [Homoserinibacter sp. YIM 151385]
MKKALALLATASVAALALVSCAPAATGGSGDEGGQKTLGIVALVATDALNAAVIEGATEEAEAAGWKVVVTDTQGSPDKANAAMTAFSTTQKVDAILVSAFASSSIGAGLASAKAAEIPVVSWGGELVDGIVATSSALKVGEDSVNAMLEDFGDEGEVLALTYHTGVLCLYRGMAFEEAMGATSGIDVTSNEVAIPGQVEDGTAFTSAWLARHAEGSGPLAIWGAWDEPGMGAIAALKQAGRTDVKVYSINGAPNALQAVQDGTMTQIIWQDGHTEGVELFTAAAESIEAGDAWEQKTIDVPGVLVDADTIDDFLAEHPDALS